MIRKIDSVFEERKAYEFYRLLHSLATALIGISLCFTVASDSCSFQGVQRWLVSVVFFFLEFLQLFFCCFVVAIFDIVHDVDAIYIAYVSCKQHLKIFSEI